VETGWVGECTAEALACANGPEGDGVVLACGDVLGANPVPIADVAEAPAAGTPTVAPEDLPLGAGVDPELEQPESAMAATTIPAANSCSRRNHLHKAGFGERPLEVRGSMWR
jgi:hypothetical protein